MQITNLPAAEGNNATQTALLVMLSTPVEIIFETPPYATLARPEDGVHVCLPFRPSTIKELKDVDVLITTV